MSTANFPPLRNGKDPLSQFRIIMAFAKDPIKVLMDSFEQYGDVYTFDIMGHQQHTLRHPDHIYQVLVADAAK